MNTCATCKWHKLRPAIKSEGFCERIYYRGAKATVGVLAKGIEYSAKFQTALDFGCNQWEKKEE